jgi:hypothetical protein
MTDDHDARIRNTSGGGSEASSRTDTHTPTCWVGWSAVGKFIVGWEAAVCNVATTMKTHTHSQRDRQCPAPPHALPRAAALAGLRLTLRRLRSHATHARTHARTHAMSISKGLFSGLGLTVRMKCVVVLLTLLPSARSCSLNLEPCVLLVFPFLLLSSSSVRGPSGPLPSA